MWAFWVEMNLCMFFLLFVYICCCRSNYQEGWDPLTSLTLPYCDTIISQNLDFQHIMSLLFFCLFNDLKWDVIVRYGGIVDYPYLNFISFHKRLCIAQLYWWTDRVYVQVNTHAWHILLYRYLWKISKCKKNQYFTQWNKNMLLHCDITVPTSSQSKISLRVQQWKQALYLMYYLPNKSVQFI